MSKRRANIKNTLCKQCSFEPLFISDATELDKFLKDLEYYLDNHPSGFHPYEYRIIDDRKDKQFLRFIKIIVTHTSEYKKTWEDEYWIYDIIHITKSKGIDLKWKRQQSKKIN